MSKYFFMIAFSFKAISRKENKQCNSPDEGEAAASVRISFNYSPTLANCLSHAKLIMLMILVITSLMLVPLDNRLNMFAQEVQY